MQKSINLNHLFNHKFIYHQEELEHKELGLDNTYILKSEISNNSLVGLNNVIFNLIFLDFLRFKVWIKFIDYKKQLYVLNWIIYL